jgi:hypothetical protein
MGKHPSYDYSFVKEIKLWWYVWTWIHDILLSYLRSFNNDFYHTENHHKYRYSRSAAGWGMELKISQKQEWMLNYWTEKNRAIN